MAHITKEPLIYFSSYISTTRYLSKHSYGMHTLSPVTGQWHGVIRESSVNIMWPLRSSLTFDMAQVSAKLRFDWKPDRAAYSQVSLQLTRNFQEPFSKFRVPKNQFWKPF
jgi:hypothetical protein